MKTDVGNVMSNSDYINFVKSQFDLASAGEKNIVFTNRGADKASAVINNIIINTKTELLIYSGCMDQSVYSRTQLLNLLNSEAIVKIICDEKNHKDSYLSSIATTDNLKIRYIKNEFLSKLKAKGVYHFIVSDKKYVRVEDDHEEKRATVYLNNEKLATGHASAFESLWNDFSEI